jgi:hypothetical protein
MPLINQTTSIPDFHCKTACLITIFMLVTSCTAQPTAPNKPPTAISNITPTSTVKPTSNVVVLKVTKSDPLILNFQAGGNNPIGSSVSGTRLFDMDGDGDLDVILTPTYFDSLPSLPILILRNDSGLFYDSTEEWFPAGVPTTNMVRAPLVADFNNDGRLDYFGADHGQEIINPESGFFPGSVNHLFLSVPNGGFSDASADLPDTVAFHHGSCSGDIDHDGRVDIMVNALSNPKSYLILNRKSGWEADNTRLPFILGHYPEPWDVTTDYNPSSCQMADMNGDSWVDIIVAPYRALSEEYWPGKRAPTGTRVYLNDQTGRFNDPPWQDLPRMELDQDFGATSIYSADFDLNGLPDILVAYEAEEYALQLWMQVEAGVFEDRTISAFGDYVVRVGMWRELDVADLNGDSAPDISLRLWAVAWGTVTKSVRDMIYINDGNGHFTHPELPLVLSKETQATFILFMKAANGGATFFGYEAIGTGENTIIPFTIEIPIR